MAVNYATKYASKVAERFAQKSYTDDDCGKNYDFVGAKTIKVYSVDTVEEHQYKRSGSNRFGEPVDLGDTVQEMTCEQAPAFSFTIDALDGTDQSIEKSAGKALKRQLDERTIPGVDKHRIKKWCQGANIVIKKTAAPTKSTIAEMIMDAGVEMDNAPIPVPADGRTLYIRSSYYKLLKLCDEFIGIEKLGERSVAKGVVGEFDGMRVKKIPDRFIPDGVYFFIKAKGSSVDPTKLQQYKVYKTVQGYSGPVVEGVTYYDAFVLGAKGDGIAVVGNEAVLAAPTLSIASHAVSITAASGVQFRYTTDGSNPRYSDTAQVYTAAVTLKEGEVFKAVGTKDGCVGIMAEKAYE